MDFCVLILWLAGLSHSFMSSSSFLVESLRYSMYSIMSSANSEKFNFFSNLNSLYFSCLIAITQTSNTVLNKLGESGHPCLTRGFRGNAFNFSQLSTVLVADLMYMVFIILRYTQSMPTIWRVFIINGYWILSKDFSASIKMIVWFLFLYGVSNWLICVYWRILAFLE